MPNETPAWMLTVRELRQALDDARPDQAVIFALTSQELADLGAPLRKGVEIVFAVRVDRATAEGPVFKLVPARSPRAQAE